MLNKISVLFGRYPTCLWTNTGTKVPYLSSWLSVLLSLWRKRWKDLFTNNLFRFLPTDVLPPNLVRSCRLLSIIHTSFVDWRLRTHFFRRSFYWCLPLPTFRKVETWKILLRSLLFEKFLQKDGGNISRRVRFLLKEKRH